MFKLEALDQPGKIYNQQVLTDGKPLLLNVWATVPDLPRRTSISQHAGGAGHSRGWPQLQRRPQQSRHRLNTLGNPYALYDGDGMLGLDLGVYGAPETFLIDGHGIIRYRHAGDMNDRVWNEEVKPLWQKYSREAGV